MPRAWWPLLGLVACSREQPDSPANEPPAASSSPQPATELERGSTPDFAPALVGSLFTATQMDRVSFGWRAPCFVPVRYFVQKVSGDTFVVGALLNVTEDGPDFLLSFSDLMFEHIDGVDLPRGSPAVAAEAVKSENVLPTIRVSKQGHYLEYTNADDAMAVALDHARGDDTEKLDALQRQPELRRYTKEFGRKFWHPWVERWLELRLDHRGTEQRRERLNLFGRSFEIEVAITDHGNIDGHPELRLLEARSTVDGAEGEALGRELMATAETLADGEVPEDVELSAVTWERITRIAIDPRLGFPHHVRESVNIRIGDTHALKIQAWEFDWAASRGCADPS